MKLRSFQITDEKLIVEVPAEEGSPAWFADPVHRWIDIEAPEPEEINTFLEPLKIDPEMLRERIGPGSDAFFSRPSIIWCSFESRRKAPLSDGEHTNIAASLHAHDPADRPP